MTEAKNSLWALFYENEAYAIDGERIMGRQAAGNSLLRAYAYSDHKNVGVYARNKDCFDDFTSDFSSLLKKDVKKELSYIPWGNPRGLSIFGGLYYPAPDISRFVNQRYFYNDHSYSIVGVTHTTASEQAINSLIECYTSQLKPWDAIICTSDSVKNSINNLYDQYSEILEDRLGATKKPSFELPIIPLGVHLEDYYFTDEEKISSRKKLGIKQNDIVVLFLGRLSFHAKAHYMPMYIALENVKNNLPSDVDLHLIQTGWFPNPAIEKMYKDDSKSICPSVKCHFLDGRDADEKKKSYASSDIFLSLVDNFQETFGLTPLEGMASGLPAVVSDWNGYKGTVRNDIDGFRLTTTTMEKGNGYELALRHNLGVDTYDHYIGKASQTVSINIKECIDKISLLSLDKNLRLKMGENAKKRAKDFDWSKIIIMYDELKNELDLKRKSNLSDKKTFMPPISIQDPYSFFDDYSTFKLTPECTVSASYSNKIELDEFYILPSISFLDKIAPEIEILKIVYNYIRNKNELLVSEIIDEIKYDERTIIRSILWLSKYGYMEIVRSNEKN
ncbi:MAG: glycosyltransferase family 4 protein [Alphaproteobacteria bacterium]